MTEVDAKRSALTLLEKASELLRSATEMLAHEDDCASAEPELARPHDGASMVTIYWAGCRGLAQMADDLGLRVDKIGTSTEANINDRLAVIGRDAYGAWTHDAAGRLKKDDGFERWIAQAIHTTRAPVDPRVSVNTRTISAELPSGLSRRGFDRALREVLADSALKVRCPGVRRFTVYSIGTERVSAAEELYAGLDPRRDGDRLLAAVESILANHLGHAPLPAGKTEAVPARAAMKASGQPFPRTRSAQPAARQPISAASRRAMIARLRTSRRFRKA